MNRILAGASALALASAMGGLAHAAEAAAETDSLDAVIVTGTRMTGLRAVDSPAPVQVLGNDTLKRVGQPDLTQALAQNVPSFTAQAFGGDTANLTLSARLRGLSPNHTLVLINGKRRHGTANLAVLGGPYQGGAAADLNFVPVASIDHVEVLQDGAAAQYGTDAIAGVINIITKKSTSGGSIGVSGGGYWDGGGKTGDFTANLGVAPTDDAWLNLTFESKFHGFSFRGDVDPRVLNTPFNVGSSSRLSAYPQILQAKNYPYLNRIQGDAEYRLNVLTFDAGYHLNADTDAYVFGSYGDKFAQAYENYRVPNRVVGKNGFLPAPLGFQPKESIDETDYSITGGFKGTIAGWGWDLSTTYGKDSQEVSTLASLNAALYFDTSTLTTNGFSPVDFKAGDFIASQWTNTLDLTKDFDVGFAKPMTLAFGGEFRRETYEIKPGDPASRYKEGSQSFPGFALTDAGSHSRKNYAVYADAALEPTEALKLDGAVRFEHFTDFGDTTVVKGTARYDFTPEFAVRGTASTGFRAPTLAESFYSATNVGPTTAFVQLPPNAPAARLVGVNGLKAEKSTNFSGGFVTHLAPRLTATIDAYQIRIKNRIVGSGSLYGTGGTPAIPAVTAAIIANGNVLDPTVTFTGINIFTNGLDTRTRGAELVVTYSSDFGDWGRADWSLSGNYNKTKVTKIAKPPAQLAGASLFDETAISYLETASPKFRAVAGVLYSVGALSFNLRESYYGKSSDRETYDGSIYYTNRIKSALLTDLEANWKFYKGFTFTVGANNLFNRYPNRVNGNLKKVQFENNDNGYVTLYPSFSPFGINGGYYYSKVSVVF